MCNPRREVIGILKDVVPPDHKVLLGRLNEISFDVPYDVERNHKIIRNPIIDNIRERYQLKIVIDNYVEYYLINEIDKNMEDSQDVMRVHAFSLGYELNDKLIREYQVTSKNATEALTDALGDTIWSVGDIDVDFDIKYRSFDVPEKTVLDFIFEIAETFNAIVQFDTVNRRINLEKEERVGIDLGLRIGYGKYSKSMGTNLKADEMVTQFQPIGDQNIGINRVNPTGSSYIESFEYFLFPFQRDAQGNTIQSSYYMSDGLCHAILDYQDLVETKGTEFATLLSDKETKQTTLATKQNEMSQFQIELIIIDDELEVAKANGDDLTNLQQQLATKQSEVDSKQLELDQVESQIDTIDSQIETLQNILKLENNFTPEQIVERSPYLIRRTWTDTNYLNDEDLYVDAKKRFDDLKKPQTVFNINIINFLEVIEEQRNWDKLNLGDTITIKYEKLGVYVKAKIIEINYNYNSGDINLTIANVKEIESDENKLIKMLYQSYSTSTSVDMNKHKYDKAYEDLGSIHDYINSDLDTTKQKILAGVDNSVIIDRKGVTVTNPRFPDEMLIIQSGVFAISNTKGQTWDLAITAKGVVAQRLYGKAIFGVNLAIENDGGTFRFDSSGALLDGAALTITEGANGIKLDPETGITVTKGTINRTILNATDGIKIQKWEFGQWNDKLYTDTNGTLVAEDLVTRKLKVRDEGGFTLIDADTRTINFTGFNVITGKEDVIKGIDVKNPYNQSTFRVDDEGNVHIAGDITMYGGSISWDSVTPPDASQIDGLGNKLTYIDANGIYTGTLSADNINGGTISGVTINVSTDLYVGNNMHLGNGYSGFKSIIFNNMARINSSGTDLDLNCAYLSSNAFITSFSGNVQISDNKHLDFSSFGGGFYMEDSTWVRVVNNKSFYTPGTIKGVIENISDRSMKKNIINLSDKGISALNTINKLNIYEYHMNNQSDDSLKDYGFMADELPVEFVSKGTEEGIPDSVKTYSLVAYLTKAVQELIAEVEYLKSKQEG
ncbi:phage tail spike protein [Fictibacillus nanhaiensis]|uniref:phage tail spike protein n=1 Tax=Fictibacillus nanhaiensis TaxID=742169 RepID=UPI002E1CA558|nr:phage tail spike protein [Fictibacillus nanhaiensis]MED1863210.1 phage tail spike protein [Fictibacillus nanhaiensis]